MSIEAMKQALEALEKSDGVMTHFRDRIDNSEAITALRTAIEQAEKQEQALDKMAENARELGLNYDPAGGTQVSKVWWDGDKLMAKPIPLSDLYTTPPAAPVQEPVATYTCGVCGVSMRMEVPNVATPRVQEPVAEVKAKTTGGNVGIATVIHEIYSPHREPLQPGDKLYAGYRWIGWDIEQVWSERIFGIDMRFENLQDAIKFRDKLDEATPTAAQRQWVGLTDEEIMELLAPLYSDPSLVPWAIEVSMDEYRAIEAKLREKNT